MPGPRRRLLAAALGWPAWASLAGSGPAAAAQVKDWPARQPTPPLRLPTLDGGAWSLADHRGHPVLLNFWASWCEPCREEMPSLELAAERHRSDGLVVVAINYQEGERAIRAFVERTDLGLTVLLDRDGTATAAWVPRVFPCSVLVGVDGRPRRSIIGAVDWGGAEARGWLADVVAGSRRPR